VWLPDGEKNFKMLTQSTNVTDTHTHTHRQTDRQTDGMTAKAALASRGKNQHQ